MKIKKSLTTILVLGGFCLTGSAYAYNPGNVEERCIAPKFKSFSPPEKTKDTPVPEVEPESEVGFTVSGSADPTTIKAVGKDQQLELNIKDRSSFYEVTSKLPPELTGKYVRIHLRAKAQRGDCYTKDGWLIKVKKAAAAPAQEAAEAGVNEE